MAAVWARATCAPSPSTPRPSGSGRTRRLARGLGVRVHAGQTDLGAAWRTIDEGDDAALSVTLADIGDGEPVNAALVVIDGVHSLVWSRSTPKAD